MIRWHWERAIAIALTVAGLGLVACVESDGNSTPGPGRDDAEVDGGRGVADASLSDDAVPVDDVGTRGDTTLGPVIVDAEPGPDDGGPPPPDVTSCQEACDRYAACERLVEIFPDEGACLDLCERASRARPPETWFRCLSGEQCGLIHRCSLPVPPPPSCEETCGAVDNCGVQVPGDADCMASCEALGDGFASCGEAVLGGRCDEVGFVDCLAERVWPACRAECEVAVECNLRRQQTCAGECIAALGDADPLARLRANQRGQCIARAGDDCLRINDCYEGGAAVGPADRATLCGLWSDCGLEFEFGFPCDEIYFILMDEGGEDAVRCAIGELQAECPFDPFFVFDVCRSGGGGNSACESLCEGLGVCTLHGAGPRCVGDCVQGRDGNPDEVIRGQARLACGVAGRCDELDMCLDEASVPAQCAAHCDALVACEHVDDADACVAECDERFARARDIAYRDCVEESRGVCGAIGACEQPDGIPCDALCERVDACGLAQFGPPGCLSLCDDAHFVDPEQTLHDLACVLSAPSCRSIGRNDPSVEACLNRGTDAGAACFNYCRGREVCEGDGDVARCVVECAAGFGDGEALRFAAARECLTELGRDPACARIDGCIPPVAGVDCAAYCATASGCGVELEGCEERCAGDPLAQLRSLRQLNCLDAADDDCEAVSMCFGEGEPPPPRPVDAAEFCRMYNACDFEDLVGFPCADFYEMAVRDGGQAFVECLADEIRAGCPPDPFFAYELCFDGPGPDPRASGCDALCEVRHLCDQLDDDQDRSDCVMTCEAALGPDEPDLAARIRPQLACREAWSCPELATCIEESSPAATCRTACEGLDGCELLEGGDVDACVRACDVDFARQRYIEWLTCLDGAAAADSEEAACRARSFCDLEPAVPCGRACERLTVCGLNPDDEHCAANCDDAHFEDPLAEARRVACVLLAPVCRADGDGQSVEDCQRGRSEAGLICLNYCRATTSCNPAADRELTDCMAGCIDGFDGVDGLRITASSECLVQQGEGASCRRLTGCLPGDAALEVDCGAMCARLDVCLPENDLEACNATCEAEPPVPLAGCVGDTRRVGSGCGGVAACAGVEPPETTPACASICARRHLCDPSDDEFLCLTGCEIEDEAMPVRAACVELTSCESIDGCLADDVASVEACEAPCASLARCGAFDSAEACGLDCSARAHSPELGGGFVESLVDCAEGLGDDCDAEQADRCVNPAFCALANPGEIVVIGDAGGRVQTDTRGGRDRYQGQCGGEGPEAIIAIVLSRRASVDMVVADAGYDPLIFLRAADCDDPRAERACNDDFEDLNSRIQAELAAGTYYLFIDGFGGGSGPADVVVSIRPL